MSKQGWEMVGGGVMVVVGLVMFVLFQDVETPVIGLRQAGLVIAVLGAIEIAVVGWGAARTGQPRD